MKRLLHNGLFQHKQNTRIFKAEGKIPHVPGQLMYVDCCSCIKDLDEPDKWPAKRVKQIEKFEQQIGYPATYSTKDNRGSVQRLANMNVLKPYEIVFQDSYASLDDAPGTFYCERCAEHLVQTKQAVIVKDPAEEVN